MTVFLLVYGIISFRVAKTLAGTITIFLCFLFGSLFMEPWIAFLPLLKRNLIAKDTALLKFPALFLISFIPVMARIDFVVIPFVLMLTSILNKNFFNSLIILTSSFFAIFFTGLCNLIFGGQSFSVSSEIKSIWSLDYNFSDFLYINYSSELNLIKLILILLVVLFIVVRTASDREVFKLKVIDIYVISGLLFLIIHSNLSLLRSWYFLLPLVSIVIFLENTEPRKFGSVSRFKKLIIEKFSYSWPILLATFILIAMFYGEGYKHLGSQRATNDFLIKLERHCEAYDRIYWLYDGSGFIGYNSSCPVINGDGLVNSKDYIDILKNKKITDYLIDKGYAVLSNKYNDEIIDSLITKHNYGVVVRPSANLNFASWWLIEK
tara:strand:- start:4561 stop:5694 length:1134 start_codon:yes stop_codon:yes gene_type:complete